MGRNESRNGEVIFRDDKLLTGRQVINQFRKLGLRFLNRNSCHWLLQLPDCNAAAVAVAILSMSSNGSRAGPLTIVIRQLPVRITLLDQFGHSVAAVSRANLLIRPNAEPFFKTRALCCGFRF